MLFLSTHLWVGAASTLGLHTCCLSLFFSAKIDGRGRSLATRSSLSEASTLCSHTKERCMLGSENIERTFSSFPSASVRSACPRPAALEQTSVAMLPSKYAACSLRPRRENTTLERPSRPSTRREWRFMQPQNMKLTAIISHSGTEATPFAGNTPTQQCKQPIPLMRIIVKALPREPLDTSLPDVRKQSDVLL